MNIKWTSKALSDLTRLYDFLAPANELAATRAVKALANAPQHLRDQPRMGEQLDEFKPREVRRILIEPYELRYEIQGSNLYVLRLWHTREDR